ncbi:MAG: hypothetical protein ACI3ZZ_02330 [Candidatus Aphodosoma sp.]
MRKISLVIILLISTMFCNSKIWYVKEGGSGLKDGSSWGNAAEDLPVLLQNPNVDQDTIWSSQGRLKPNVDDTIFVAQGTYSPIVIWDPANYDSINSMYRTSHRGRIKIFGGFSGKESSLSDRINWPMNESIIDGEGKYSCLWIEGQDSIHNQYSKDIVIDGFTLRNGFGEGAAIRIVHNSPLLSNLNIVDNVGNPILWFENCDFDTLDRYSNVLLLYNSVIARNVVYNESSNNYPDNIMYFNSSQVYFMNTTIAENLHYNQSYYNYVGFYLTNNSNINIINSIIYFNSCGKLYEYDLYFQPNLLLFNYCDVQNSRGSMNWGCSNESNGGFNIDKDPSFIDTHNLNYMISKDSPCYNTANNIIYHSLINCNPFNLNHFRNYDVNSNSRFYDNILDMGACEYSPNVNVSPQNIKTIYDYCCIEDHVLTIHENIDYDYMIICDITGKVMYNNYCQNTRRQYLIGGYYILSLLKDNSVVYSTKILIY